MPGSGPRCRTAAIGSSNTSSPTSASSSTSDAPARRVDRAIGWLRLGHPFPSVLDGLVSGGVAAIAGADLPLTVRIGLAMASLQLGIGTTNDIVDAVHDRGRKPGKPIPAGYVTDRQAKVLASTWFVVGIGLCASAGPAVVLLGLTVIAIGLAYDLRLKGTRWSWLPFAIGIPILPVFGWAGATGGLHPAFALLVPAAVAAGAALAIGNALVDVERDGAAGQSSIALSLGPRMAASVAGALTAVVTVAAVVSGAAAGEPPAVLVGMVALGGTATAAVATAAGRPVGQRERAWQVEAVALAGLAILWVRALLA